MNTQSAILLTGATGFLGGRLLVRLLRDHHRVLVLCRARRKGSSRISAKQRIHARLAELNFTADSAALEVIDSDIADIESSTLVPQLRQGMQRLGCSRLLLVNIAASLKMDYPGQPRARREATRQLNQRTNVDGLAKLLESLDQLSADAPSDAGPVSGVVHFSTCYAHGRSRGSLAECALTPAVKGHNSYESSKHEGEARLAEWQSRQGYRVPVSIVRPSIVTGPDTDDGYVAWLDALAQGADDDTRPIDRIAAGLRRWRVPFVPLLGNANGELDFIDAGDVERFGYAIVQHHLSSHPPSGMQYLQLANPNSPTLKEVVHLTLDALGHPDMSTRFRIIRGLWVFTLLLRLFSWMPLAGPALRGAIKRTEMLRPYLLRPSGTYFETHSTKAYFAALGIEYAPRRIDAEYVRAVIAARQAPPESPSAGSIADEEITIECPRKTSRPSLAMS